MENKKLKTISDEYNNQIHLLGRITNLIMIILLLAIPVLIMVIFNIKVDFAKTLKSVVSVLSVYGIVSVVEFLSFTPLLGSGGTYLAFITGNVTNMKLPAALSAMQIAEVEPGSSEGELISVIAIAVSSLVTSVLIFLGMIIFSKLEPILNSKTLAPAFNNLMPALIGSLAVPLIRDNIKTSTVPILIMAILTLTIGYETVTKLQIVILPIILVITVLWAYFLFKKNNKKNI